MVRRLWYACLVVAAIVAAAALAMAVVALTRARLEAPPPTLMLTDREGRFLGLAADGVDGPFGYWPLERIPQRVAAVATAAEDRRFCHHPGVDPIALARAVRQNWCAGRRVSGASTIAMQVARMQRPGPRTYGRKAVEAVTALALTLRYGRKAVLAHYLTLAPFGNGNRGIAFAARRYLDKPIEDLSWAEAAFLLAIPQAPGRSNPYSSSGRRRAVRRGQRILDTLKSQGVLCRREYELAARQITRLYVPARQTTPRCAVHVVERFRRLLGSPAVRRSRANAPLVVATLYLPTQERVQAEVRRLLGRWRNQGAGNGAAMVVSLPSASVVASVGSADYFDEAAAGAIDYTRVARSPGSVLKPFIYGLALERDEVTPATILDDVRRGPQGIANADGRYLGPLLFRQALANSRNVPAAELVLRVGLAESFDFTRRLGLHEGRQTASHFGPGLALGTLPVTLEDLLGAYTVLSGNGILRSLRWFDEPEGRATGPRLLREETARLVSLFLSDPLARLPTFPRMGNLEYAFPVAVKTGTSSRFRDAWTVAWSRHYLVGVWVGHPDCRTMANLSGYRAGAVLARRILGSLHPHGGGGLQDLPFPPPQGYVSRRICARTGLAATRGCETVFPEWFPPGHEPRKPCPVHVQLAGTPGPRSGATYQSLLTAQQVDLRVVAPENGLHVLRCPDTPAEHSTLALEVEGCPAQAQVVWYVDGQPFHLADYPFTTRWPLEPGVHAIHARLAGGPAASQVVSIRVD